MHNQQKRESGKLVKARGDREDWEIAKVGDRVHDGVVVSKISIFDLASQENAPDLSKFPATTLAMFDLGAGEVKELLHELWTGYLLNMQIHARPEIAEEIPQPRTKMLSLLQKVFVEMRKSPEDNTPENADLLRNAFDLVSAMPEPAPVHLAASDTSHGYHKLIRTRLRQPGTEAPLDLSCIDPEANKNALTEKEAYGLQRDADQQAIEDLSRIRRRADQPVFDEAIQKKSLT